MQFQRVGPPLLGLALVGMGYRSYGWPGVALAVGALVMWMLLHFTRMLQVLKRAANQPVGSVGSAVMLNAQLRRGVPLLHVVALAHALGERLSLPDAQPEVYRWTDALQSHVTCTLLHGRLQKWELLRPETPAP